MQTSYWLLGICLILSTFPLRAQTNCEDAAQIIRLAERDLANRTYERAINRLLDARDICAAKKDQVNRLIKQAFQQIEGEKRSAKQAQIESDKQQKRADSSLSVAEQVLDQMYFYEGKFGLTLKDAGEFFEPVYRYGFINRKGETVIPFVFEQATPFSLEDGFARVSWKQQKYLLDTTGQIYRLAESLAELQADTEALDLQENPVASLPKSLAEFKNLKVLLLGVKKSIFEPAGQRQKPKLKSFPEAITQLPRLKFLDLRHQGISSLPESIGRLDKLKVLLLADNKIASLPTGFGQLASLEVLTLEKNALTVLPAELTQLDQLRHLNLSTNKLNSLPERIGELSQLQSLNLMINQLSELPESIGKLRQLAGLGLSHNRLQSLPESIAQIQSLEQLVLSYNQLDRLPKSIKMLVQLKELFLDDNQFESLPPDIGQLNQLLILSANNNQLTSLPNSLNQLRQLEELYLVGNQLTELPPLITQLSQLRRLFLSSNAIKSLPEDWGSLDRLEGLFLASNQIESLPQSFFQLRQLELLNLEDNQIRQLADKFTAFDKLRYLNLNRNQLTSLPPSIGKMKQVRELYLRSNQLASLPSSLGQLKELKDLGLESNQLREIPEALCQIPNLRVALGVYELENLDYTMDFSDTGNSILKGNPIEQLPNCYLDKHGQQQLVEFANYCIDAEHFAVGVQTLQNLKTRFPEGFAQAKEGFYEKLAVVLTYAEPSESLEKLKQLLTD